MVGVVLHLTFIQSACVPEVVHSVQAGETVFARLQLAENQIDKLLKVYV
jgi:hypothetical protein